MDVNQTLPLLAGLNPSQFMRRYWQKKPLLVRQAIPGFRPVLTRAELFQLASEQHVESRLVEQHAKGWRMKQGPFGKRSLPALSNPGWTLLVQGVDLHVGAAHELLQKFRFLPDARLDDLMISYATPGGGVGPHFDSYDVFLLQASGRRRWKIGRQRDLTLQEGVPLKILQNFEPEQEFLLEAGDMLYLPPRYAHDGLAESAFGDDGKASDCMTYSIGFRAPGQTELAREMLQRLADFGDAEGGSGVPTHYRDATQAATSTPAALPDALLGFARNAVSKALQDPLALACALGEYLTEPKETVWFEDPSDNWNPHHREGVSLDLRTRMMYDSHHVFINGESYRAGGRDATLMQRLADHRFMAAADLQRASPSVLSLLADWHGAGWLRQG
ncbi:MAG TPA: cupin domain-containing protein [Polaromonas sp.]|uniref:cupin domain-containing protein n=1 Tax=Polaromonas sp. TaxID=1869339 RepID=UPI002D679E34|nr:cupin domain-containing protein [Polaromonas sp.]HYW55660.1 cupin domain-containing protein [Polaromonas sp.]